MHYGGSIDPQRHRSHVLASSFRQLSAERCREKLVPFRRLLDEFSLTVCRLRLNTQELRERIFLRGAGLGPPWPATA